MTPPMSPTSDDDMSNLPPQIIDEASSMLIQPLSSAMRHYKVEDVPDEELRVTKPDFTSALLKVQPSAMREGFTTIPNVKWSDVGAMNKIKDELKLFIQQPIRHPEVFEKMKCLSHSVGVLLYGPPGCGKTLVAKAIANESGANFISIKGPELLNKYVGESERSVRNVFQRAQASKPCVLFFDELDSLAAKRGSDSGNASAERVVNQLLTELDGVKGREGVYVIGATNRIDMIDPAMLRPGRLDKMLYVPLPDETERVDILKALTNTVPMDENVRDQLKDIAMKRVNFSGADLSSLVREAASVSVQRYFNTVEGGSSTALKICVEDFNVACSKVRPSVTEEDVKRYNSMVRNASSNSS
jgi:ribosome biogenesis ATPase